MKPGTITYEAVTGVPQKAVKARSVMMRFRAARRALERYKGDRFYPGTPVVVDCARYTGPGMAVTDNQCPEDQVAVRVPSGNVWWYPIEYCRPGRPEIVGEKVKR